MCRAIEVLVARTKKGESGERQLGFRDRRSLGGGLPQPYSCTLRTSSSLHLLLLQRYRDAIMTLFYQGSLQEGIALAVRDAKAVTCFVRGRLVSPRIE
jgi:hypothetical protein